MVRVRPHFIQLQEVQIPQLQCSLGRCLWWRPNSDGSMPKSTILPKCDQSRLLLGKLISNETLMFRIWGPMIFTLWSLLSQVYISSWTWLHLFCRCFWYLGRVGRMVRVQPHLVQWQEVQIPQLQQCCFGCFLWWQPNWNSSMLRASQSRLLLYSTG